jgi:hypothetical protein
MIDPRDILLERMKVDLIGPGAPDELITDRPTDRYLTGILFPPRTTISPDDDDEASDADDADGVGTALDGVKAASAFRPSSAGLSFAVRPTGSAPRLRVRIDGARYRREKIIDEGVEETRRSAQRWRREPRFAEVALDIEALRKQAAPILSLSESGLPEASLHCRIAPWGKVLLITIAVTNDSKPSGAISRAAIEEAALFQFSLAVECETDCCFVPKPDRVVSSHADDDTRSSALLYRNVQQWAVGHTCSAVWSEDEGANVSQVKTSWLPEAKVNVVSADGDIEFRQSAARLPLSAGWLASKDKQTLLSGLNSFVDGYGRWISRMADEALHVPGEHVEHAGLHIQRCRLAEERMRAGIAILEKSSEVLTAFRLANAALALQYSWRIKPEPPELVWRPFQLGFALLCLRSIAEHDSPDRETMDLLWFPTGGGKTEAYLLLTAFTIFLRRLRASGDPRGAGVTTFMRYTLRLLTIQQFERAAALICACELVRRGRVRLEELSLPAHFGSDSPISLGLWVGEGATPNTVAQAERELGSDSESSPAQLRICPCCHKFLHWSVSADRDRVEVRCNTNSCDVAQELGLLPIWTVDEDIYREQPTLLIGTIDKYAQITRNQKTGLLFGIRTTADAPELVIQDELHLISGPLGSLAGLYEVAIDELCKSRNGFRPKVIGSTATIRRAEDQIKALFDRASFQFPPPGLDHSNSGFAIEDRDVPGRRYLGISTVGRSAKFTQQAVAASLLQAAKDQALTADTRDGYWTLVNYFNSLRELGGALVLMRDDVARSIKDYAARRLGEVERDAGMQIELTSRVRSSDIPKHLKDLERDWNDPDHVDIVLASNMISVGMDVSRLGLMVVNGQPKTIAEYIQATSRVGRSKKAPGLVITLFNAAKSRDRSRYETFASWHRSLYRDVEATSVTPFAPRARDRALHAPFVAMVRHLVRGMENPGAIDQHQKEAEALLATIISRIERIDPAEAYSARMQLDSFLDDWFDHQGLTDYWQDYRDALLTSAETAAERGNRPRFAKQKPTPNSLRSVEASTSFVLLDGRSNMGSAQ